MWRRRQRESRHLTDDGLLEAALVADQPESADHPARVGTIHLRACPECARRYSELSTFLTNLSQSANAAADRVLTPERLLGQRQKIMRRLEKLVGHGQPARVLRFPSLGRPIPAGRPGRRWLVGAAAVGLVVGVAAGRLLLYSPPFEVGRPSAVTSTRPANPSGPTPAADAASGVAPNPLAEEEFLIEVEAALDSLRVTELQAIDAMTPRIREIAVNIQ